MADLKPDDTDIDYLIEDAALGYEHATWMVTATTWVEAPTALEASRIIKERLSLRGSDRFDPDVDKIVGWNPHG